MEQDAGAGGGGDGLQFDKVELATPEGAQACRVCKQPIEHEYFEVNGHTLCQQCAGQLGGDPGLATFLRAAAFGAGAALLGTIVWFAIIKLLDRELGLLAIGVGLFVGMSVRKGARGAGGRKYQLLAMALTYMSITASYVPFVIKGLSRNAEVAASGAANTDTSPTRTTTRTTTTSTNSGDPEAEYASAGEAAHQVSIVSMLLGVLLIFGVAFASPFLGGFDNLMGLVIIGIALYEAWKMNRRIPISGPFRLAPAAPAPALHVVP